MQSIIYMRNSICACVFFRSTMAVIIEDSYLLMTFMDTSSTEMNSGKTYLEVKQNLSMKLNPVSRS